MMLVLGLTLIVFGVGLAGYAILATAPNSKTFAQRNTKKRTGKDSFQQSDISKKRAPKPIKNNDSRTLLKEKLFKAGIISDIELRKFYFIVAFSPVIGYLAFFSIAWLIVGTKIGVFVGILGAGLGFLFPSFYLRSKAKNRQEEISYYLPIVIEQIAIGVSSSLDVGPCIQLILEQADERETNNAVTELLKLAVQLSRQGIPFDEALLEVGKISGNVDLKHCFLALGQVYKHGGEISKQLMEIANSVSQQRHIKVDEKIKKLPVKGILIVGLMVFGFLITVVYGLGYTLFKQLSGGIGG